MSLEKYTFLDDFDKPRLPLGEELKYTDNDLEGARLKALREGVEKGRQQEKQSIDSELIQVLGSFQNHFSRFVQEESERRQQVQYQASQLAKEIALKICISEAEKNAVDRVLSCFESVTKSILETPKITLFVHPKFEKVLAEKMNTVAQGDSVNLIADASIAVTDCKLEWQDGSAESILERIIDQIGSTLESSVGHSIDKRKEKGDS